MVARADGSTLDQTPALSGEIVFVSEQSSDVPNIFTTDVIPNPFAEGGRERDLT